MSIQTENNLKKLFGAFGRRPLRQQFDVYIEWAERYSSGVVEKVVVHSINNEEKLPTIANLIKTARSLSSVKRSYSNNCNDDCWFCAGTGFLPELCEPTEFNSVHHIRNYGCKCSKGEKTGVPGYFSKYDNMQFGEEVKEYPQMNYYQFVYFIKNQKNKEIT